jgi:hypothetical protein
MSTAHMEIAPLATVSDTLIFRYRTQSGAETSSRTKELLEPDCQNS